MLAAFVFINSVFVCSAFSQNENEKTAASKPESKTELVEKNQSGDKDKDGSAGKEGWHVFRGDAGSSGVATSKLPEKLETLWEYKVPGGKGAFESTAVIAKSSTDQKPIAYIGDLDGTLYALDLETGELKWSKKLTFSFSSSPAYRDGLIYIGDIDGELFCVDEKGNTKWKFTCEGEISSSPNFYKGDVLFGSQDSKLYLLNAKTGEKIWAHETPDQIRCSITVAGCLLYTSPSPRDRTRSRMPSSA